MPKILKRSLIRDAEKLMDSRQLADELVAMMEEQRGSLGFLLNTLRRRHRTFNPYILKGRSVYRSPAALDIKTAELVAVSASVALRCEHCLEAHMNRALEEGATMDEVLDTILIAGAIAESSTLSVAFRKYRQQEGRRMPAGREKETQSRASGKGRMVNSVRGKQKTRP